MKELANELERHSYHKYEGPATVTALERDGPELSRAVPSELFARVLAALRAPGRVSVKERLPALGTQVLIWPYAKSGNKYDSPVGIYDEFGIGTNARRGFKSFGEFVNVTHWQPLPTAPKGE